MTDTARTKTALIALAPDNSSGAISAQDLRDVITSAMISGPGVYKDVVGTARVSSQGVGSIVVETYRNTAFALAFTKHNADTWIQNEYQFNHDWNATGAVYPHVHYIPAGTSGVATFRVTTQWAITGQAVGSAASATVTSYAVTLTAGTKYASRILALTSVAVPTLATASSILMVKVERRATSDANDTYQGAKDHGTTQANLAFLSVDVHHLVTRAGTETPY